MYDWKYDQYGWPTKVKARLVAGGNQRTQYIDFGELFAPTVAVSCVRFFGRFRLRAGTRGISCVNIEQAFVNSPLEDGIDVCMRLMKICGMVSGLVVELAESLCGLTQAYRQWNAHLEWDVSSV